MRAGDQIKNDYAKGQVDFGKVADPPVPVFVGNAADVARSVIAVVGQPLTFVTMGLAQPADVALIPFYQVHHRRYTVYWKTVSASEWELRKAAPPATNPSDLVHSGAH